MARALASVAVLVLVACQGEDVPAGGARARATDAALTGYTSGIFCTSTGGVTYKVQCGCPGAPCDDGNPDTLFDFCADDMDTCLPGTTQPAEICGNGADDDCDLLVDGRDPECMTGCSAVEDCNSPADDDCDGLVNGDDWDCVDAGWGCWGGGFVAASCNTWCVASCFDGVRDGDEGAVDCGGSCEAKCGPGASCWTDWDCASGACVGDVCR
jgi:hypothetical protein